MPEAWVDTYRNFDRIRQPHIDSWLTCIDLKRAFGGWCQRGWCFFLYRSLKLDCRSRLVSIRIAVHGLVVIRDSSASSVFTASGTSYLATKVRDWRHLSTIGLQLTALKTNAPKHRHVVVECGCRKLAISKLIMPNWDFYQGAFPRARNGEPNSAVSNSYLSGRVVHAVDKFTYRV